MKKYVLITLGLLLIASTGNAYVVDVSLELYKNETVVFKDISVGVGQRSLITVGEDCSLILRDNNHNTTMDKIDFDFEEGFWLLSDPPKPVDSAYIVFSLRYSMGVTNVTLILEHNNRTLFSKDIYLCDNDSICEGYENYLTCQVDCPSGSKDGFCDHVSDGTRDPDCAPSGDPDYVTGIEDGVCDRASDWICDPDCTFSGADLDCLCGNGKCDIEYKESRAICPEDCILCSKDSDCTSNQFCYLGKNVCIEKYVEGRYCREDRQCVSGNCKHNVCTSALDFNLIAIVMVLIILVIAIFLIIRRREVIKR